MFQTLTHRPLSRGSTLSTSAATKDVPSKRSFECQSTRSVSRQSTWDKSELDEPHAGWTFQPQFRLVFSHAAQYIGGKRVEKMQVMGRSSKRNGADGNEKSWYAECADRFASTGIDAFDSKPKTLASLPYASFSDKDGAKTLRITDPRHEWFEFADIVRRTCRMSFNTGVLKEHVEARKLCANTKDERYPVVYQSLEKQSHITYLVGRVELERHKEHHKFAWFMLSIAAGLGQLDAALLLHSLEKTDASYTVYPEQRAVITAAATQMLDWRSMVAHCEHLFLTAKKKSRQARIRPEDLEPCLEMLEAAMNLTSPTREAIPIVEPLKDFLDVDLLERFLAPYQLILDITSAELAVGNKTARVIEMHEKAARDGALVYNNPDAAWIYADLQLSLDKECNDDWLHCAKLAAMNGHRDASFQLGRYHFYSDKWYPSTASKVLAEKGGEIPRRSEDEELAIHNEIMARKNKRQLKLQEGMFWMEMSAQLNTHSATKMLNRYIIAAFLLRQNGFLEEGKALLIKAKPEFKNCVDDAAAVKQATTRLDEHVEYWNKKLVHQMLEPEFIGRHLNEEALK